MLLARRRGKPVVLTLYGTEIWHYRPKRVRPGPLHARLPRARRRSRSTASGCSRARSELGLDAARHARRSIRRSARRSRWHDDGAQAEARAALGITEPPPAPQRQAAAPARRPALPDRGDERGRPRASGHAPGHLRHRARCSTELQAIARSAGVERHVTFAGLVDNATVARYCAAADLFVLPSLLEALPTVAVEALAVRHAGRLDRQSRRPRAERRVRPRRGDRAARAAAARSARAIVAVPRRQAPHAAGDARDDRAGVPRRRASPRATGRSTTSVCAEATGGDDGDARRARSPRRCSRRWRRRRGWRCSTAGSPALRVEFDATPPRRIVRASTRRARRRDAAGRSPGPARRCRSGCRVSTARSTGRSTLRVRGARAGGGRQPRADRSSSMACSSRRTATTVGLRGRRRHDSGPRPSARGLTLDAAIARRRSCPGPAIRARSA